ncbi:MAG: acylneuraminate cytidylyltransferase [Acidobacteria bacterium]|nr:acylneuraminate cytidylyltransferase [Acidobacteriota bacterium]
MSQTAIVIQARMGSRRLPGKSLMTIGTRTLLEHAIVRLGAARLPLIVATTDLAEDDVIADEAAALDAGVFRGHPVDVLSRYLGAARAFGLTTVVRATADNPFVDGESAGRTLALAERIHADHVVEFGLPVGAAVEVVSAEALERAGALATEAYDREHVTSLIRRDSRFHALRAMAPRTLRRPGLRLTVDTEDDLAFARRVHEALGGGRRTPPLAAVIRAADALLVQAAGRHLLRRGA